MATRKPIPKPYSEKTRDEKIAEHRSALANLRHPHNRYGTNIYDAINRHLAALKTLGAKE